MYDIIVIGGGASGLLATLASCRKGKRVLLIEKQSQCGLKLRITGKGHCNLTNMSPLKEFLTHCGSEPRFLYPAFNSFFNEQLVSFFEQLGLKTVVERGQRVYPFSHKAQDVFFALINEIETEGNVTILKQTQAKHLIIENSQIKGVVAQIGSEKEREYFADNVILATGGLSYPLTGSTGDGYALAQQAGHTIITPLPSLIGFQIQDNITQQLFGFTIKNCKVTIKEQSGKKLYEQFGDLEFEQGMIAGPIILSLSRLVAKRLYEGQELLAVIDFKPALEQTKLTDNIIKEFSQRGKETIGQVLRAFMPKELEEFAIDKAKLQTNKKACMLSADERKRLVNFLKNCTFYIQPYNKENLPLLFQRAVVTQGGVCLKEINPKTLESKIVSGLYFCGEVMDLDADTGGYNLQIAFSTAWLACQGACC